MTERLPTPDRTPLARSPLQVVVCQVRFEDTLAVSDSKLVLAVHERLGGRTGPYRKVEPVKGLRLDVQISVGGAPVGPNEAPYSGWRFSSGDGWTISLMPDNLALETTKYTTWEGDFKVRLGELIDAVAEEIAPSTEQRLGLRYIDRLSEPTVAGPIGWRGLVANEFLGPVLHPELGPLVSTAQQQMSLDIEPGIKGLIKHGLLNDPGGGLSYLLDFDVFREDVRAFEPEAIKTAADQFNEICLQLFQLATTDSLRTQLAVATR